MKIRTIGYDSHIITVLNGMVYFVADTLEEQKYCNFPLFYWFIHGVNPEN